jgi:malonyl-CoA/methylmalonyl-CoA synthetase
MNIAQVIAAQARKQEGKTAILFEDHACSYASFDLAVERYAATLHGLGMGKGDRVAYQLPKCLEALFLHFAILSLGAVALPLNPDYRPEELEYFLTDSGSRLFITDLERLAMVRSQILGIPGLRTFLLGEGTDSNTGSWTEALSAAVLPYTRPYAAGGDETAMFCYTSGTTGRSKGAMITHRNLLSNAEALHQMWHWSEGDRLLHVLPLFHVHGLNVAALGCLYAGATMVMHAKFEPQRAWDTMAREHCTLLMAVPTVYQRLMNEWERLERRPDLSTARLFVSGSAPLSDTQFRRFEQLTGFRILERYGMTETGMIASNLLDTAGRKEKSVGYPLPGVLLRIMAQDGTPVPPGGVGEVWVQGQNVFKGYWGLEEKTRESFVEGWFRTGDLGWCDPSDGDRLYLVGRAKELIISGGFNVYPKEVENVLEGLSQIREAAVIGLPDDDFGERVVAVVVLDAAADTVAEGDLISRCKEQLAGYKCPREVHFVKELPRNAMGKLQKNLLVEQYR